MIPIPNPVRIKSEVKDWAQMLFPIIVTIIIVVIVYKVYKASKAAAGAAGQELGFAATALKTGVSSSRISEIASMANDLWDNHVGGLGWFTNRNYDEQAFIDVLNNMQSQQELVLLDQYYRQVAKESLKTAVNKSFSAGDKAAVKTKTLGALMQMT